LLWTKGTDLDRDFRRSAMGICLRDHSENGNMQNKIKENI